MPTRYRGCWCVDATYTTTGKSRIASTINTISSLRMSATLAPHPVRLNPLDVSLMC